MKLSHILLCLCLITLLSCQKEEERLDDFYTVEDIPLPEGLLPEVGGMDFMPDGKLAVAFHRGEVMLYDPDSATWQLFARGLHDPLGVLAVNAQEMLVMQRPELTHLKDTDGDGEADEYMTVTDDFGMSGNYHEFAYGPIPDGKGNYILGFNAASNNAGVWDETRGAYNPLGNPGQGMYSPVPYRGWLMLLTKEDKLEPFASGFRSPDGIAFAPNGELFVTDNQGDWLGTSTLYHVEQNRHYGHIASLVWRKGWEQDLNTVPVATFDSMRTKAAVLFPHNIMADSPTQPLFIPDSIDFGPFGGQLLVSEMDYPRIMRVMLEEVQGEMQGACISFMDSTGLTVGNHRMAFGPDGSLWVGKTAYAWVGDQGIQRIRYNGGTPMDVLHMNVTPKGFDLTFTRPLNVEQASDKNNYHFNRYYYAYHAEYGSPRMDEQPVEIRHLTISDDRTKVSLELEEMVAGYVYDLQIDSLKSQKGVALKNRRMFYTVNRLP
ncbi:DUF7133 domain-containing protein [Catalinimonas niigatensis]|uniref:DUF7133 domain-containing protein n=1 Tax=Catalinimonas niigatensis TaxID=1397264 RepID=UPI00266657D3|nr:hypothetical protein [Catalinimonas niigatensis]WPP49481.1 hypothetical protein PZB72_22685 [Catalinimonas niigatensis]